MSMKPKADKGPIEPFRPSQISITQKGIDLVKARTEIRKMENGQGIENRHFICLKDSAGKLYTIDKEKNKLVEGI